MTSDERIILRVDSLAFGGDAVGRDAGGRVIFVPGGAPGDTVEVRVLERKKAYARGELVRLVEAGRRRRPPCPYQEACGGCPWQHVEEATQREAKQEVVRHALKKTGVEVLPIAAAPMPLGYRVRAKLTARSGAVGFQTRRSHRVVDVDTCLALAPPLDAALQAARRKLRGALGDGATIAGLMAPGGAVHLDVEVGLGGLPETLADQAAELVGEAGIVGVSVHLPGTPTRIYGAPEIDLGGGFHGSAGGFQQANWAQNELLRHLVREAALPAERILELYAGDGNFTRDLAASARVVAVEGDRQAAARLVDNLRRIAPRLPPGPGQPAPVHRWAVRPEGAAEAVRRLRASGERFDVIVLDPPRAGAADVLEGLAAFAARRIVYVSCDPMTLARDVRRLGGLGYRALTAQPVDMMPQTSHVEVVCVLGYSGEHSTRAK